MDKGKKFLTTLMISGFTIAVLTHPANAHTRGSERQGYKGGQYYRQNRWHQPHGEVFASLPGGFITIVVGGSKYFYRSGHYYHNDHHGYYAVSAPFGACIRRLPYGYQTVYVKGRKYFVYNEVYYKQSPGGYVVVENPYGSVVKYKTGSKTAVAVNAQEVITLNIPNSQGTYTAVAIQRSGEGFVGPQGEYYEEFPKIEQLRIIYGS